MGPLSGDICEGVRGVVCMVVDDKRSKTGQSEEQDRNERERDENDGGVRRSPLARTLDWSRGHDLKGLALISTGTER